MPKLPGASANTHETSSRTQSCVIEHCSTERRGSHLEALLAPVQLGYWATSASLHARWRWWQRFLSPPVLHHWRGSPPPTTAASRRPCSSTLRLCHSLAAGHQSDLNSLRMTTGRRRCSSLLVHRPSPANTTYYCQPAGRRPHIIKAHRALLHAKQGSLIVNIPCNIPLQKPAAHQALFACVC